MSDCCPTHHTETKKKTDWVWILALGFCIPLYILSFIVTSEHSQTLHHLSQGVMELIHQMSLGVLMGIVFVGLLDQIPREFTLSLLGQEKGISGILRATLAGVLLDLCSHGILMVGTKLYKKGASLGQVMAFLIASPWNSFSLTIILSTLIGFYWTLLFILLSMIIALISGLIFDICVRKGLLPENPNTKPLQKDFLFVKEAKKGLKNFSFDFSFLKKVALSGFKDSKIIIKWLLFGVMVAVLLRTFIPLELYQKFLGPGLIGLIVTLIFATVLEVCSEGSAPIAADIFNIAGSPGNSFAFLMTGVSTDYTEIMVLKETTHSWRTALFLPLITVPQVILISWLISFYS